jgi:hypothetical protein
MNFPDTTRTFTNLVKTFFIYPMKREKTTESYDIPAYEEYLP